MSTLPPAHMTPIERLIDEHRMAFMQRQWYEAEAWSAKAHAEIKAMGEVARRGLGQKFRHASARLRAQFQGDTK